MTQDLRAALTPNIDAFLGFFDLFEPWEPPEVDDNGRAVLDIRGVIGVHADADEMIPAMRNLKAEVLEVHISSAGGNVWHGVDLANFLRQHSARVEVHVDSMAASAGSVIAMAGDEIIMHPGSMMMVHNGRAEAFGLTAEDLRDLADVLTQVNGNMAGIYAARAGGTAAGWLEVMAQETWFTGDEALAAGLADRVVTAEPASDESPSSSDAETGGKVDAHDGSSGVVDLAAVDLTEVFGYKHNGREDAPDPGLPIAADTGEVDWNAFATAAGKIGVDAVTDPPVLFDAADPDDIDWSEVAAAMAGPHSRMFDHDAFVDAVTNQKGNTS